MHRKYCFQGSCDYNVLWSSLHNLGQRYFWIDSSIGYLERVWLVFFIKEKNLVILWYLILTVLGGATEVTLAVAGEGPILGELQFSQHSCQPLQTSNCIIWTVQSCWQFNIKYCLPMKLTGKARWWSVRSLTHSTLFNPNPLILSR